MKYPIDLAHNYMEMHEGMATMPPDEHYPDVRLEWPEKYDLPLSGTITFRYRTTKEETKTFPDGKQKFCLDLDLLEIVSAKAGKTPDRDYDSAAEGLDKLKAELEVE